MNFQTFSACGGLYYSFNRLLHSLLENFRLRRALMLLFLDINKPYLEIFPPAAGYNVSFPTTTYNL